MTKYRLDYLLVQREAARSREEAQRLIRAGKVLVDETVADKPGVKYAEDSLIRVVERESSYAGRGGLKLEGALKRFSIDPSHRVAADLGASTGGFTECLLRLGAKKVFAIDVGRGQLAYHLQIDPRVVVLDRTNCRYLQEEILGERVDIIAADLSFISVRTVFPAMERILKKEGEAVVLIKPQFEIGKGRVGKRGIVRSQTDHLEVLESCRAFFIESGWQVKNAAPSPIAGKSGNIEFFLHLVPGKAADSISYEAIRKAVEEAHERENPSHAREKPFPSEFHPDSL
ncbi:MAG: TlyA family RNA methyltransferase [Candidatus Omnitrophota bacterium]